MIAKDIVSTVNFIASATNMVSELGITLETGSDFSVYKDIVENTSGRGEIIPAFDPDKVDFDDESALWIIGRDDSHQVVHTQAVRTVDLATQNLASFLESSFEEYTPANWLFDVEQSQFLAAPGSYNVKGKVCCHGEFWIEGGPKGYRSKGLAIFLTRIGMALSMMKWSPDFIFALMQSLTICKGLAARAGFMHASQTNMYWSVPDYPESLEVWVAWVSRNDIGHLMKLPPEKLCQQLTGQQWDNQQLQAVKIA